MIAWNEYYKSLPKRPVGAGVLFFNNKKELLIVKPTYKDYWTIPGGVVDGGESPLQAVIREVKEELNLDIELEKFLSVAYISFSKEKKESIQFIFYGGVLTSTQIKNIELPQKELSEYKFLKVENALPLLSENTNKRVAKSLEVIKNNKPIYLEYIK